MSTRRALSKDIKRLSRMVFRSRRRPFVVKPSHMGQRPGLNYDCIPSLLETAEGEHHR